MPPDDDYRQESYRRHERHYADYAPGEPMAHMARNWAAKDTVDAWRHRRMHAVLDPLIDEIPDATWLTVGDGRFGNDAHYLFSRGRTVLATDISDHLLREAREIGYIPDFRKENAECLSFPDGAFDFVLCKESYHHFPRPMIALYEMLRVARKAVVLIEPNDPHVGSTTPERVLRFFLDGIHLLRGNRPARNRFEEVGNYVYALSRREVEKVALGLNYGPVAFKGINDWFEGGQGSEKAEPGNFHFRKARLLIGVMDLLAALRIYKPNLLAAAIFKQSPSGSLRARLRESGYDVIDLPANPHHPLRGR